MDEEQIVSEVEDRVKEQPAQTDVADNVLQKVMPPEIDFDKKIKQMLE